MLVRWLALLSLTGCIHVHVYTHGHVQGGEGLEPGDPVVARWHGALYQGIVITVQGKLVTVSWDDGSKSFVRRDWVAAVVDTPPVASEGDWVLCNAGSWQICQVTRLGNEVAYAPVSDGAARPMHTGVVAVPAGLADWVAKQGAAAVAQLAAQREMEKVWPSGAGQSVRKGAQVLASEDGGATWHEAEVVQVGADDLTVIWQGGTRITVPRAHVAALGPADFSEGSLVLCKWAGGTRWWRAKTTELSASALTVTYSDGTSETLPPKGCTPAERRE